MKHLKFYFIRILNNMKKYNYVKCIKKMKFYKLYIQFDKTNKNKEIHITCTPTQAYSVKEQMKQMIMIDRQIHRQTDRERKKLDRKVIIPCQNFR